MQGPRTSVGPTGALLGEEPSNAHVVLLDAELTAVCLQNVARGRVSALTRVERPADARRLEEAVDLPLRVDRMRAIAVFLPGEIHGARRNRGLVRSPATPLLPGVRWGKS